jgi:phage-related protein
MPIAICSSLPVWLLLRRGHKRMPAQGGETRTEKVSLGVQEGQRRVRRHKAEQGAHPRRVARVRIGQSVGRKEMSAKVQQTVVQGVARVRIGQSVGRQEMSAKVIVQQELHPRQEMERLPEKVRLSLGHKMERLQEKVREGLDVLVKELHSRQEMERLPEKVRLSLGHKMERVQEKVREEGNLRGELY